MIETDQLSLWGLFLIGLCGGFLLAACAWLPLYDKGRRDGRAAATMALLPETTDNLAGPVSQELYDQGSEHWQLDEDGIWHWDGKGSLAEYARHDHVHRMDAPDVCIKNRDGERCDA